MRAVVLVGGFGTRLRPLTNTRPKQMLPIVNRPMIEHVVGHLAAHGIDDVVLSMGYRPDAFAAAYPAGRCAGATLHYAVEPEPLDTAGAIRFAALDAGIDSRFLVVNGDVLTDVDLTAFVAFHESRGAEGTIHLFPVDDPSRFGVVPTDEDGRVLAFVEKPPRDEAPTNLINAGTYVLEPSVLDRIPGGRKVSVERETFPAMAADGTLYAWPGATYWLDTGTPEQYLQAQLDLLAGVRGDGVDGVDPTARVHADATVERSVLGAGAVVEAGATVRGSVLLPGAVVRAGCQVVDSVLGEGAEVLAGARVAGGTVVGDGEVIESGTSLEGARVPVPAP
ncbi:MAG TPA: NDP-sugar synthase [Acidimicrobiales bacterium]